jgi:hypothetical protein
MTGIYQSRFLIIYLRPSLILGYEKYPFSSRVSGFQMGNDPRRIRVSLAWPGGSGDRRTSSRLYKVNIWMWHYGCGRPRMVSIAEDERIRSQRLILSVRAGSGRQRLGSVTERPLQHRRMWRQGRLNPTQRLRLGLAGIMISEAGTELTESSCGRA